MIDEGRTLEVSLPANAAVPEPARVLRTIIALFDDTIDAEHALTALRKTDQPSEGISVILRERLLDPDPNVQYQTVLSRVVASSALDTVGSWLQGLASLILPDRASYLVAGPIGAVLATIRDASPKSEPANPGAFAMVETSRQLSRALAAFGFSQDEAQYLEARVVAGSPLIAVTSGTASMLRKAHQSFATWDAVHIGLAHTESSIQETAARLLLTGPDGGGSVVIADAIAPLRRLTIDSGWRHHSIDLRGRQALDASGEHLGQIVDVLFETRLSHHDAPKSAADRTSVTVRYIVVRLGGFMGLGKSLVAIPAELADTTAWTVPVETSRAEVRRAPRFTALAPLSRQDEVTIREHFGVPVYWITDQSDGNHGNF